MLLYIIINTSTSELWLLGAKSDEELKVYIPHESVRCIFWEEHEKLIPPAVVRPAGVTAYPPLIVMLLYYSFIFNICLIKNIDLNFFVTIVAIIIIPIIYFHAHFFYILSIFVVLHSCAGLAAQAQTTIDLGPKGVISNIKPLAAVFYHSSMILYCFFKCNNLTAKFSLTA